MNTIKYVKISPFYNGSGWYDSKSGIFFSKKNKDVIKIKDGVDLTNIKYYIRRNYLIDVTSQYDVEAKKLEEQQHTMKTQANNVSFKTLLKEEAYDVQVKNAETEEESVVEQKTEEKVVDTIEDVVEDTINEEETAETEVEEVVEPVKNAEKKSTNKKNNKKRK